MYAYLSSLFIKQTKCENDQSCTKCNVYVSTHLGDELGYQTAVCQSSPMPTQPVKRFNTFTTSTEQPHHQCQGWMKWTQVIKYNGIYF